MSNVESLRPDERIVRIIDFYLVNKKKEELESFECQYIHARDETELLRVLNLHEREQIRYGVKDNQKSKGGATNGNVI